jgi:3-dehydroquinate synthetase
VLFADTVLDPDEGTLAGLLQPDSRVLAVVDPYSPQHMDDVAGLLKTYRARKLVSDFALLPLASSARAKTSTEVRHVIAEAERLGLSAHDRLLVVGGGTIMDIVGYAAYLYQGQTPYIRVPTTLVGMIDAGIGLKVGVNANGHKNLLGAYHAPLACVCDQGFLETLPVAERRCGLAEAIKISVVCDRELYDLISRDYPDVLAGRNTPGVRAIVHGSISCLLHQLEANPFEDDVRRLPDFGHEFGHMLESLTQYRLRHGEAVAVGMALSSWLAAAVGYLSRDDLRRMLHLLLAVGLDVYDQACDPERLWHKLRDDVLPHKAGQLHLVVPRAIGTGGFIDSLDEIGLDLLSDACRALRSWNQGARS